MGHFILKSKKNLAMMEVGDEIQESDFATLCPDGTFVQLEYIPNKKIKKDKVKVEGGIFTLTKSMMGLGIEPTEFIKDDILKEFVNTENIINKVDCFFSRLHVYKKHNIEFPKRCALLFGSPGTGKTTAIIEVVEKYNDGKTFILVWGTDKFHAGDVKSFLQHVDFSDVDRIIVIAEDIGGVEAENARMSSDPSLLSLLDNKEKTFTKPVFILATTNHPEMFLANIANRPQRIDDKIEVGFPTADARIKLYEFYSKTTVDENIKKILSDKKCEKFTPAHIQEVILRSELYDKTVEETINDIVAEMKNYENAFNGPRKNLGF